VKIKEIIKSRQKSRLQISETPSRKSQTEKNILINLKGDWV